MELIEIEEKARRLVVQATERERQLHLIEARNVQPLCQQVEYKEELRSFVACIAHLNSALGRLMHQRWNRSRQHHWTIRSVSLSRYR
eukprot:g5377.t1